MKRFFTVLLLTCVLASAMWMPALADDRPEIEGLSDTFGFNGIYENGVFDKYLDRYSLAHLQNIRPGTTLFMPLTRKDFEWVDDKAGALTRNTIEELGLELIIEDARSDHMVKEIKLAEFDGKMGISIAFADTLHSLESWEFDTKVKLLVHGMEYRNSTITVAGTLSNRSVSVRRYDTKCTLGTDRYAIALDNVQNIKFHLGEGLYIISDMELNDKYYGYARQSATEADKAAQAKYPQIKKTLQVYTLNFGGRVRFDLVENGPMYVYDDTFAYLGTTDDAVAYREKYYLADSKLA